MSGGGATRGGREGRRRRARARQRATPTAPAEGARRRGALGGAGARAAAADYSSRPRPRRVQRRPQRRRGGVSQRRPSRERGGSAKRRRARELDRASGLPHVGPPRRTSSGLALRGANGDGAQLLHIPRPERRDLFRRRRGGSPSTTAKMTCTLYRRRATCRPRAATAAAGEAGERALDDEADSVRRAAFGARARAGIGRPRLVDRGRAALRGRRSRRPGRRLPRSDEASKRLRSTSTRSLARARRARPRRSSAIWCASSRWRR